MLQRKCIRFTCSTEKRLWGNSTRLEEITPRKKQNKTKKQTNKKKNPLKTERGGQRKSTSLKSHLHGRPLTLCSTPGVCSWGSPAQTQRDKYMGQKYTLSQLLVEILLRLRDAYSQEPAGFLLCWKTTPGNFFVYQRGRDITQWQVWPIDVFWIFLDNKGALWQRERRHRISPFG